MMSTLITGASGFVGLALTEALLAEGHDVMGLDQAPAPDAARACFAALPGVYRGVVGDVRDTAVVAGAMKGVDRMVVLAAITAGPAREAAEPEAVIAVNVGAVATAVRLAIGAGLRRVVLASSVAVYGAQADTPGPLMEEARCAPRTLYGITKYAAEAVAARLATQGGLDLVIARLGACFGPWEHATGLRDTLSPQQQVMAGRHSGGVVLAADAVRDWLYVRDAAAGLVALLTAPTLGYPLYNVGAGREWPLSAWCDAVGVPWRIGPAPHIATWSDRPSASIARLQQDTGFSPRFDAGAAARDWRGFLARTGSGTLDPRPS